MFVFSRNFSLSQNPFQSKFHQRTNCNWNTLGYLILTKNTSGKSFVGSPFHFKTRKKHKHITSYLHSPQVTKRPIVEQGKLWKSYSQFKSINMFLKWIIIYLNQNWLIQSKDIAHKGSQYLILISRNASIRIILRKTIDRWASALKVNKSACMHNYVNYSYSSFEVREN